ncbi:DUF397 domain-containing protein [Streptomyces sp. NPDC050803]|uniref:DUF397 domain-containing protein n=1 Tax=unclassified Streptomyces TaxID=2593676 RepID=UPI003449D7A0
MPNQQWKKSSYSSDASNCVEIAAAPTAIRIRDSKTDDGPRLAFPPSAWMHFISHMTSLASQPSCTSP